MARWVLSAAPGRGEQLRRPNLEPRPEEGLPKSPGPVLGKETQDCRGLLCLQSHSCQTELWAQVASALDALLLRPRPGDISVAQGHTVGEGSNQVPSQSSCTLTPGMRAFLRCTGGLSWLLREATPMRFAGR